MYEEQPRTNAGTRCYHLIQDNVLHDHTPGIFSATGLMYGKVFALPWKRFPFENKLQWESWQRHRRLLCENWISLNSTVGLGHSEGFWIALGKASVQICWWRTPLPGLERIAVASPLDRTEVLEWNLVLFSNVPWERSTCRRAGSWLTFMN